MRERVRISRDPAQRISGGASAGALSAACVALRHPDAFGSVLAQSGAFWRGLGQTAAYRSDPARDDAGREWRAREIAGIERVPVPWFVRIGTLESASAWADGIVSMIHASRHVRDVLVAKGYPAHYHELSAGQ